LLSTIGAYALRNLMIDVWVVCLAGVAGYFLRRSGYSVAGVVLGLILGGLGEANFVKSMQLMHYDALGFFARPIAATLIILGVATIGLNIVKAWGVAAPVAEE
jgi:putative tricarboxylic transport membrane protein